MRMDHLDSLMASTRPAPVVMGAQPAPLGSFAATQAAASDAGREVATGIVERIRREPHLLASLTGTIEAAMETAAAVLLAEGISIPHVAAYRLGFIRGTQPIVRPFLREMAALVAEPVAPAGPRPLRPEDFGCTPVAP